MSLAKADPVAVDPRYSVVPVAEEPLTAMTAEAVYCGPGSAADNAAVVEQVVLVAPADLSGDYEFPANVNGSTITVKVPPAGVRQGETFTATVVRECGHSQHIPTGHWRDGVCDCCKYGCCHPLFCLACCCQPLALGQVMTRLKLDPFANETRRGVYWTSFKVLLLLFLVVTFTDQLISQITNGYYAAHMDENGQIDFSDIPVSVLIASGVQSGLRFVFFLYMMFLIIRTRAYVRSKYRIPEQSCSGCEDCCCAFWLPCCTILQMARHTADYDTYAASCCSETGLPPNAPCVV